MFLKVCGITRVTDALHAAAHGAHAVGFVFWSGSPRRIAPEQAGSIVAALPPTVVPVGVFVNESVERIRAIVEETGIRTVQLHGDEAPAYASAMEVPVLRAIGVDDGEEEMAQWPPDTWFLLDASDPLQRGGTGRTVDWHRASGIARRWRVVLAGGLTDANVAEAVSLVRPFGVDVSSGVEDAPGVKNPDKVARFLAGARSALEQYEDRHR